MSLARSLSSLAGRSPWPLLMASALLLAAPRAAAQDPAWIRQLGTTSWDSATATASDGAGGLYVGGFTFRNLAGPSLGPRSDAWLARYDTAGNQLWISQFGTSTDDFAWAAVADGSGGVYVSGTTHGTLGGAQFGISDIWVARYDGAGNQLWIRQFGSKIQDWVRSIVADGSGGVYVGGITQGDLASPNAGGFLPGADVWLARFDGAGNRLWARQFGTYSDDTLGGLAPDGSGEVFVSGTDGTSTWLARYDGSGQLIWTRYFGTIDFETVYDAAPDGSGGVYLVGTTNGTFGGPNAGFFDAWVARFDSAGGGLWVRQFGTVGSDIAWAAASDGLGGVYVTGTNTVPLPAGKWQRNVWLARFDGSGNQQSISRLGTSADDDPKAAAPDGLGGVYVSGETFGSLGGPNAGQLDAWFAHWQ